MRSARATQPVEGFETLRPVGSDMSRWTVADVPDQTGRTVVVTGANSGLGFEATRVLARRGATVVLACRSVDRGAAAADRIRESTPDADLDVRECDLASLSSVESFADGVRSAYDDLHVLCNNAGVMAIPRSETEDGFEAQLGINHLGHFALTAHLLDALVATDGETRVVTHSSGAHQSGTVDFDDLHGEDSYGKWSAYSQSKLANLLFTYELQRRLDRAGITDTRAVACHPGYADTKLQARGPEAEGSTVKRYAMAAANAAFAQSAERGALPLLYAATADGVDGGDYVGPGGFLSMRGHPETQESSDRSHDEETAERLWRVSEDETGVTFDVAALAAATAND
jgi:NAD(P)-dependent dehydrogenase (short-subunit alcohol dehydrogenase family)